MFRQFAVEGEFLEVQRYDGGHINDTYFASYRTNGSVRRYVHQRINTAVFPDTLALQHNVERVTQHVRGRYAARGARDIERRVLRLIPTRDGAVMLHCADGACWRTYAFIERTFSRLHAGGPDDAYAAARAFGEFSAMLSDLPANELRETIPSFHDTPKRYAALEDAISADVRARCDKAEGEIAAARALRDLAPALQEFAAAHVLPLRAVHNDTKITNVLFDRATDEAVCVVDLDTVMPGLVLFDAGEMVRTASSRAAEDEPDPGAVVVDETLLEAVMRGFADGAGDTVTAAEREAFVLAGRVLAFENGVRFLTDYLRGDVYFRISRENHNLDRARAQFALARALEPYQA